MLFRAAIGWRKHSAERRIKIESFSRLVAGELWFSDLDRPVMKKIEKQAQPQFLFSRGIHPGSPSAIKSFADAYSSSMDGTFALFDRTKRSFLSFYSQSDQPFDGFFGTELCLPPVNSFFYDRLHTNDSRFVKDSIDQVLTFLKRVPHNRYRDYRLTIDACLKNTGNEYLRLMCHLFFFPPLPNWPNEFCLLVFHCISSDCRYSPPLRHFCETGSMHRPLFTKGEGFIPTFTPCRQAILKHLMMGKLAKEVAPMLNCSKKTIDNTVGDLLRALHLTNTLHLVHYWKCFSCRASDA